jgi:hypothetical protein
MRRNFAHSWGLIALVVRPDWSKFADPEPTPHARGLVSGLSFPAFLGRPFLSGPASRSFSTYVILFFLEVPK